MDFRTKYSNDTGSFVSDPGKPYLECYEYGLDSKGRKVLKKTKEKDNVYEKIQSYAESTDINNIMARFALGDEEALNVNKGYYIDTTNLPKNLFEVVEKGIEAENYFNSLPVDLKALFDNSASEFYVSDPIEFEEKFKKYNEKFVNHQFDVKEEEKPIENNGNEVIYNG